MDGSGQITAFDKASYDQLIGYLKTADETVNTDPRYLGPSANMKLDTTLTSTFHPGSSDWPVADAFIQKAADFGQSAQTRYNQFETDARQFYTSLKNAEDVFDQTNDLSTYEASQFSQDYPDVAGTSGTGGSSLDVPPPPGSGDGSSTTTA